MKTTRFIIDASFIADIVCMLVCVGYSFDFADFQIYESPLCVIYPTKFESSKSSQSLPAILIYDLPV